MSIREMNTMSRNLADYIRCPAMVHEDALEIACRTSLWDVLSELLRPVVVEQVAAQLQNLRGCPLTLQFRTLQLKQTS